MKISLGPVLYYWPADTLREFYQQVAHWPVDIVYLGETVCGKRRTFTLAEWMEIGFQLQSAGKEVVLSTLSLLEAESELKTLRNWCENGQFTVEANDMAAVNLLAGRTSFITGPTVNIYNQRTLHLLYNMGLKRWVLPVELSRTTVIDLQANHPEDLQVEVYSYGRLPLSMSARCFTARAHNLPKDNCQYRCIDYPEGMTLYSQEGQPFLVLNGVQTMSALFYNLLEEIPAMINLHVDVVRISPVAQRMEKIVRAFHEVINGAPPATVMRDAGLARGICNGYWFGYAGMENRANPSTTP